MTNNFESQMNSYMSDVFPNANCTRTCTCTCTLKISVDNAPNIINFEIKQHCGNNYIILCTRGS